MKTIKKFISYIQQHIKMMFKEVREDFENRVYREHFTRAMSATGFNEDFYEEKGQVKVRWVKK
jgi:hypothetical protein